MTLTEPGRKSIVQSTRVRRLSKEHISLTTMPSEEKEELPPEVWIVSIQTKDGMKPERSTRTICRSEAEANEVLENYPIGAEIEDEIWLGFLARGREFIESIIDGGMPGMLVSAGDEDLYLPWKVLKDAGVSSEDGLRVSPRVLDFLGKQRIEVMKRHFGENWQAAAEFEYCWLNFPKSSPAFIAATCNFHFFVTGDDFSAGYLLHDLENLVYGVEAAATKTLEMRKKAGALGSEKSAKARLARRAGLLVAMEDVTRRNPDVVQLGDKAVAELALAKCAEAEPALWSQGRGQVQEYLGEIRRGEAGREMQERFHALFPNKPNRRLGKKR